MSEELKPCPFCGFTGIIDTFVRDGRAVGCPKCSARVQRYEPDALGKAIAAWNTRATAPGGSGWHPCALHPDVNAKTMWGCPDCLAELRREKGWREIGTAPRDGTPIIVGRDMGDFGWVRGWATWESTQGIEGWISHGFGIFGELGLAHPTHWQPLPAPPVATGSGA